VCIPTSVRKIGEGAFRGCGALSIVVFESPSTVTEFGPEAFSFCISLESFTIPSSLVHIDDYCFDGAEHLSQVIFESPSQLSSTGSGVLQNCPSLSSLFIPPRLQMIDGTSFYGSGIIDVEVDPENQWFHMMDSYLIYTLTHSIVHSFSEDSLAVIPNSIQEVATDAFAAKVSLTTVTFESPSIVAQLLSYAFCDCSSLKSICIPSSVQLIDENCFSECVNLVSVAFEQPSMLVIINMRAFHCCKSLPRISIPASIQMIGQECFLACDSLTSITFESPSNLVVLCDLGDLMMPSVEIPDSVEVIRGMTRSLVAGSIVISFGSEPKLSAVYQRIFAEDGIGAFVRYSEATLRKFRANVDDFAQGAFDELL
jgi:hypothetical protein